MLRSSVIAVQALASRRNGLGRTGASSFSRFDRSRFRLKTARREESHGMVQPEDIDSGHSNFQLGARSGRYHHNLDRLRANVRLAQALRRVVVRVTMLDSLREDF
jgi:hypothetical protein